MTDQDEVLYRQLFGVRRSVRYHRHRQAFFDALNDAALFVTAVAGSAACAAAFATLGWTAAAAAVAALASAFNLVIAPSRRARRHDDLARRFIELEQSAVQPGASASDVEQRRLTIEQDEPPVYRVLDTICHNEVMRSLGHQDHELVRVPLWMRVTANVTDIGFYRLRRPATG